MWVTAQFIHTQERAALVLRSRAIRRRDRCAAPRGGNFAVSARANAGTQRSAQVGALGGVEAAVPHAVGGQAAAVAGVAERRRRRGDDAEHGAVGQHERDPRCAAVLSSRGVDVAIVRGERGFEYLTSRDTTLNGDHLVAPPTSMYSMKRTSASTLLARTRAGTPARRHWSRA